MTRKLSLLASLSVLALSGCAFDSQPEDGSDTVVASESEVASVSEGLKGDDFDPRDALLSALGTSTIDCLGTVGPTTFKVSKDGTYIDAGFGNCPTGDERAMKRIKALLTVQHSKQGLKDEIGKHFAKTWATFQKKFPKEITECATWKKVETINPPTFESIKKLMSSKEPPIGKENYAYKVNVKACKDDPKCAVNVAWECAGGFGTQLRVSVDPKKTIVVLDPPYWLIDQAFPTDADNPFLSAGYFHGMSFYGREPGALYGAVERSGEACSTYDYVTGKHRTDGMLIPIDCGDGWECMSYCIWVPTPQPAPQPIPAE